MSISQHVEAQDLKTELEKLLQTLKNNRDKVPLQVLKSKYKTGYDALCKNISHTASEYAKQVSLHDIRIHKDYLEEAGRPEMFAGETLRLKLADGAVYPQTGTFGYVDNQIDKSTNSIAVYADFANPDKRLVANAYVNVLVEKKYRGMIVRKDLVYIEPDGSYIYVAGANGVVKTAVNILSEYGNNNYILKNTFTPGESIVLDKMGAGDEGHKFKIVMEGAAAAGEKN